MYICKYMQIHKARGRISTRMLAHGQRCAAWSRLPASPWILRCVGSIGAWPIYLYMHIDITGVPRPGAFGGVWKQNLGTGGNLF